MKMNNDLYVWVDKELNLITTLPSSLPKNWRNYNGITSLSERALNELGWFKIDDQNLLNYNYSEQWLYQFKMQLFEEISRQRWEAQTEAVTYNGNVYVLNEGTINALYQKRMIVENNSSKTFYWKTRDSVIELTSQELVNLTTLVNSYIQECFNTEKTFINTLSSLNTLEELLQVNLNIVWPSTTLV